MKSIFVLVFSLLSTQAAFAAGKTVAVTEQELGELSTLSVQIARLLQHTTGEFDDADVMPNPQDRQHFREDMGRLAALLSGQRGLEEWITRTLRNPPVDGTVTPPPPPPAQRVELKGFFVVGKDEVKDLAVANNAHQAECNQAQAFLAATFGTYFDSFSCGATQNLSPYGSIGYLQYASNPVVNLRIPGTKTVQTVTGGAITGAKEDKDPHVSYVSWWEACKTWIQQQKSAYGTRFVAAACGVPTNVSSYASIGYKIYRSQGSILLAD